jgi:hydrogenase maturation factor
VVYSIFRRSEDPMSGLVDIVIPSSAQAAAEALGLKVSRSVTSGVRIRQIPQEDAEIALECLRDWGFAARIMETATAGESASEGDLKPAA